MHAVVDAHPTPALVHPGAAALAGTGIEIEIEACDQLTAFIDVVQGYIGVIGLIILGRLEGDIEQPGGGFE